MTDERPAGWYPAAHASDELRYWDGKRWLDWTPEQAAEAASRPVPPAPPTRASSGPTVANPEPDGLGTPSSTPDVLHANPDTSTSTKRRRTPLLLAAVAGGLLVAGGVAAVVVTLMQPSALERAGAECAGSKPFMALLDDVRASASPDAANTPSANTSELEDLFQGVVTVEDGGKTLIVNTKPEEDDAVGLTSLSLDCIYEQLQIPASITARIGQTRALDGRQDGEWDGFSASWSYHPDSGANLIIVQN